MNSYLIPLLSCLCGFIVVLPDTLSEHYGFYVASIPLIFCRHLHCHLQTMLGDVWLSPLFNYCGTPPPHANMALVKLDSGFICVQRLHPLNWAVSGLPNVEKPLALGTQRILFIVYQSHAEWES